MCGGHRQGGPHAAGGRACGFEDLTDVVTLAFSQAHIWSVQSGPVPCASSVLQSYENDTQTYSRRSVSVVVSTLRRFRVAMS